MKHGQKSIGVLPTWNLNKKLLASLLMLLGLLAFSLPMLAHHNGSQYDGNSLITLKGTVKEFYWGQPHAQIYLDVNDGKGNMKQWGIELSSPSVLIREGAWSRTIIKAGDQVTIIAAPSKRGTPLARLTPCTTGCKLILPDGREVAGGLGLGEPPAAAKAAANPQSFDPRDLEGIWDVVPSMQPKDEVHPMSAGPKPPFTPVGQGKFDANKKFLAAGGVLDCDPFGTARSLFSPRPIEIFPSKLALIEHFEYYDGWREIWTDGRKPAASPDPSWWGYSTGKWEGGTLVVDVIGFNGKTMLSTGGLPMSDALHETERYQRLDHDTLKIAITIDDRKMYTKPWTVTNFFKLKTAPEWNVNRDPCTMEGNREWDQKIAFPDGQPAANYQGEWPNR
jgi:Family of unknown function (DUF6152)